FRVADKRALDFRCSNAMAGHVQHVVDPAHNPEVAIFILARAISGKIAALYLAPVRVLVALRIAPNTAQHAWPWFAENQLAASVARHSASRLINHLRKHSKEWQRG